MTKHICDSEFPWCPADAKAGDFYKLRLNDLSPTQFAVGKAEIQVRAGRMRKKYKKDPAKLHDYLRTRPIPILVKGDKVLPGRSPSPGEWALPGPERDAGR